MGVASAVVTPGYELELEIVDASQAVAGGQDQGGELFRSTPGAGWVPGLASADVRRRKSDGRIS